MFKINGMNIKISVPMPRRNEKRFCVTSRGKDRSEDAAFKSWEQESKQRWRCLLLSIKAKLEAVESGISTIETEFLAFVVLGNGVTVSERLLPHIRNCVENNQPLQLPNLKMGK